MKSQRRQLPPQSNSLDSFALPLPSPFVSSETATQSGPLLRLFRFRLPCCILSSCIAVAKKKSLQGWGWTGLLARFIAGIWTLVVPSLIERQGMSQIFGPVPLLQWRTHLQVAEHKDSDAHDDRDQQ